MKTFRRFFWFVPTIVWMVVIFQFSAQEAQVSSGLSLKITYEVAEFVHNTIIRDKSVDELVEIMHPGVRKAAHMAEYAVLYILLFLSFFFSTLATRSAAISIIVSFIYACVDEYHQTHVLGRAGNFFDVCVDMTGVLFAVALVLFIYSFWQSAHLRKEERKLKKLEMETDEKIRLAREEGARLERERLLSYNWDRSLKDNWERAFRDNGEGKTRRRMRPDERTQGVSPRRRRRNTDQTGATPEKEDTYKK